MKTPNPSFQATPESAILRFLVPWPGVPELSRSADA